MRSSYFKPPSDDALKDQIATAVENSSLTKEDLVDRPTSTVKRNLMKRWGEGGFLSTLDLQRVLRIIQEIGDRK